MSDENIGKRVCCDFGGNPVNWLIDQVEAEIHVHSIESERISNYLLATDISLSLATVLKSRESFWMFCIFNAIDFHKVLSCLEDRLK